MNHTKPSFFSALPLAEGWAAVQGLLSAAQCPPWMVAELQNRLVLFLNHVIGQERTAQERLRSQQGKPVKLQWGQFHISLAATAAGLLEQADPHTAPALRVTLTQTSPLALAQTACAGGKPSMDIQGDVQLAAEVAWLVDNVRWDAQEDLCRLVGDGPAHLITRCAHAGVQALKSMLRGNTKADTATQWSEPPPPPRPPTHAAPEAPAQATPPTQAPTTSSPTP